MSFFRKFVVVTGGAAGIGRRVVEAFAAAGAGVAFIDGEEEAGLRLADALGPECLFMPGDVSRADVLSEFAERVVSRFGRVDFLVNAVHIDKQGILSGCGYEDFIHALQTGAAVPYQLVRLFLGAFSRDAAIVNILSAGDPLSRKDMESSSAAGGALLALTRSLAVSLSGRVRVNAVSFGREDISASAGPFSETGKTPPSAGRAAGPDGAVALVLFLCGTEASFITGQHIAVDGGMTRG
jgi:NAD(P)-dependent dehydrogenase (short-subunit alcohol dehydrogenase family)